VIVAHHGGEFPALLTAVSGGIAFASVTLVMARDRLSRLRRRIARWRT
jgi:hypothetical protein